MVTESPLTMLSELGFGSGGGGNEDLSALVREQWREEAGQRERELSLYRSGSAPTMVDGSLTAANGLLGGQSSNGAPGFSGAKNGNGLLSVEELRADPAYVAYYYTHVHLNPRLPPPMLSKEDWRQPQRVQVGSSALGGIGDRRKLSTLEETAEQSRFSLQPVDEEREATGSGELLGRGGDGLSRLSVVNLPRERSYRHIVKVISEGTDELGQGTALFSDIPHAENGNEFNDGVEPLHSAEAQLAFHYEIPPVDGLRFGGIAGSVVDDISASAPYSFASTFGSSLSKSASPGPQLVVRAPSPCLPLVDGEFDSTDKEIHNGYCSLNGVSSGIADPGDLIAAFSGMNLTPAGIITDGNIAQSKLPKEIENHWNILNELKGGPNYIKQHPFLERSESGSLSRSTIQQSGNSSYTDLVKRTGDLVDWSSPALTPGRHVELYGHTASNSNSYLKANSAPAAACRGISPAHYQNDDSINPDILCHGPSEYSINPALPSAMANNISTSNLSHATDSRALGGGFPSGPKFTGAANLQNFNRTTNHTAAAALQMPLLDPLYLDYLRTAEHAAQAEANFSNLSNSYVNLLGAQKAYLGALLPPHKQYGLPFIGKNGGLNLGYYGQPPFSQGMSYPGNPSPILPASHVGPGSLPRHGDHDIGALSGLKNLTGGVMGSWHSDTCGGMDERFPSSLLEAFKSNKTRCYELSEIAGHVVEFSADQYGSRFIQQKLETAMTEEKDMVYEEIMPQALTLMTDVFGNYVVQKFFEHGSPAQIRELANKLNGHVLALSLQMYGCRVIQKALEVVDLDQKTRMVTELDGHVMRCVRDQNGNHVIQKCIECIPQDAIDFIISTFYDQVVILSTHPYGCRVIQRILEHCDYPKTQQIVMDEIMQCVCMLAQDQYGNYVVQHVLEYGKPRERSSIIKRLAGQIVQMSQQKFASNVVEKCLIFGGPVEHQILVTEMLGSTDENEPLQAMMKDQFGNYVVQKVLETCDDQQRELILSRIKVHLSALKKYTYGKHIVARVEKLVAAGERRLQSSYTS